MRRMMWSILVVLVVKQAMSLLVIKPAKVKSFKIWMEMVSWIMRTVMITIHK